MSKLENLINKKFGCLSVIERVENYDGKADIRPQYLVICDCGNTFKIVARNLKRLSLKFCHKRRRQHNGVLRGYKYGRNINGFTDRGVIIIKEYEK